MKTIKNVLFLFLFVGTITLHAQYSSFEVEVVGTGAPIVLFPGFTCTGAVWEDTVAELSQNYECHIFTFAGFGNVPPLEKPWLPKIKEGVANYISENELGSSTIIGHSLGGALGLWLASENNTFKKLIVVDALPSIGALMMPNFKSEDMVYDNPYAKQLLEMKAEEFEQMASQMADGMTLNTEKRSQIKDWIVQADRETYVYGYTDLLRLDLRQDIAKIEIPVTILAATHPYGLETVKANYSKQYGNLEKHTLKFAEGSAHFVMYDRPEWFIEQLRQELQNQ